MSVSDFPQRIELELVSACNLKCVYCPRHHMDALKGFMDFELFERLIAEIAEHPQTILVLHRRGESLMHPRFVEMCSAVKGKFADVQLATNATLLDERRSLAIIEAVDFLSFSLDAPAVFEQTRLPAKYDKVEANILKFLEINQGQVRTQVSMVQTENTKPENVAAFQERWHGKVDRVRVYEEHSSDGNFGSLKQRRLPRKPCMMPSYEMLIYCDGKVGRCNHDWDGPPLGDIGAQSIHQVWHSSVYEHLREEHRSLSFQDPVCKNCDSWYPIVGQQKTGMLFEAEKKQALV